VLFLGLMLNPQIYSVHRWDFNKEVLLGLLLGIPALALTRTKDFSAWDESLGNLSYGVFLNHVFCIWVMRSLGIEIVGSSQIGHFLLLLAWSTAMALVSYYVRLCVGGAWCDIAPSLPARPNLRLEFPPSPR